MRIVPNKQPLPKEPRRPTGDASDAATAPPKQTDAQMTLFNRELSLLEFYRRVLEEALDETQPLLERLKFLSIFSSNIDEFFMIRVSGLKEALDEHVTEQTPDGMTPEEQLYKIRRCLLPMIAEQTRCLRDDILPQLEQEGILITSFDALDAAEQETLREFFTEKVFPVLTPLAVDPSHPFPNISGLSLNLGLMVEPMPEHGITRSLTGKPAPRFVRLKVPHQLKKRRYARLLKFPSHVRENLLNFAFLQVNQGGPTAVLAGIRPQQHPQPGGRHLR
jgi:polyphosphate kinase